MANADQRYILGGTLGNAAVTLSSIAGGKNLCTDSWLCKARPICLRLFLQLIRRAASRAACTAGKTSAMRIPMIAMTTSNSTSVKAFPRFMTPSAGYDEYPLRNTRPFWLNPESKSSDRFAIVYNKHRQAEWSARNSA